MHLLSACSKYAPNLYISRHDAALKVIYYNLRHRYGIDSKPIPPYDTRDIPAAVENDRVKIFWNFAFSTTLRITANKPDLVVIHRPTSTMFVLEMTCPSEKRILEKETEKRAKYKDLIMQLNKTYPELKVIFIPLVIGVLGGMKPNIKTGLEKLYLDDRSTTHIVNQMQKYVILGSLRVLRAHEASFPTT